MVKNLVDKLSGLWGRHYAKSSHPNKSFLARINQTIFVVFVVLLAFFSRNNPYLEYPHVLYFFGFFVLINIIANVMLSRFSVRYWGVDLLVTLNCFAIAGILNYSGGIHSYLWILYLLPIFMAAMLLETRHLVWTSILGMFFVAYFYGNPFSEWDSDVVLELAGKFSLLFFGAFLMHSLVVEKEKVEDALNAERGKLDDMAAVVAQERLQVVQSAGIMEVGKMTSGIIHDLGTPISVILGSARIIEQEEVPNKVDIQRIVEAALFCKNIISNTLKMAKGQEYKMEDVDLRDPADSAIAISSPLLKEKGITLKHSYKEKPPCIKGSFLHLERLFLNLVMNSKGALGEGGEIIVSIKPVRDSVFVEAVVEDNGPGFPEQLLKGGPQAFLTTKKPGEGTGLGLVVCKEIVEKHGGSFELSNKLSGGARITVRFPAAQPGCIRQ